MAQSRKPLVLKHHALSTLTLAVSLTTAGAVARADALSDLREQTPILPAEGHSAASTSRPARRTSI